METMKSCAKTTIQGKATCSIAQTIAKMVRYHWSGEQKEIDVD